MDNPMHGERKGGHPELDEPAIARDPGMHPDELPDGVTPYWDEHSGSYYFHDKATGETSWDLPRSRNVATAAR